MTDNRLWDLEEIKQLRARFMRCVDLHDWEAWRELLVDDYRLEAGGSIKQGRDAIVDFVSTALAGASTVHQVFAPDVTFTGPDTATATWGYEDRVVIPADPDPIVLHGYGYLTDEYVRTASGWRVKSTVENKLQSSDS
jgi:hypothetical protein